MTEQEAIRKFRALYERAPLGEKALAPIIFGLKYADELVGLSINRIAIESGHRTYHVGIRHGRKLAKYVTLDQPLWDQ